MEKKMTFNYFYGTEADQFSFYRIPKALFTDSYFKDLSSDAKSFIWTDVGSNVSFHQKSVV